MKKLAKIIMLTLTLALFLAVPIAASAGSNEPALNIEAANLSFEDSVYPVFAVSGEDVNMSSVKLLVWTSPKTSESEYIKGTENAVLNSYADETIDGVPCKKFKYTKLYAKNMTDDIYVRAYAEVDGEPVYSGLVKYSVLKYAYNKLGYTGTASTNADFRELLISMLQYGANAQKYSDYRTDRLATDSFYKIYVNGGYLSDGTTNGLYLEGENVTVTAPATDSEGRAFVAWIDSYGVEVATVAAASIVVEKANATYTASYEAKTDACEHDFVNGKDVPAVAPDCENPGVIAHKLCKYCGTKDTENTVDPALGHVWADHEAVAPGCTTEGQKAYSECTVCDKLTLDKNAEEVVYVTAADLVVAPQHSYDLEGKPVAESKPTCTKFGFEFYGCTVCGQLPTATDSYNLPIDQNGWVAAGVYRYAMLPHEYDVVVTPATCTDGEVRVYTCFCGDTYTETDNAPGHTWYLAEEKKPSCVADGYKLDKCEICGVTRIDETTDADGKYDKIPKGSNVHEFDAIYDVVTTAPTCTKRGQLLRYCPYCYECMVVDIAPLSHNAAIYESEVPADCNTDGYYVFVCDICNEYESRVKASDIDPEDATFGLLYDATKHDALGHDISVKGEIVAPTCDKYGYTVYSCANGCGKTENHDTVSALGHDYSVVDAVVDPTCLKGGYTVYSCANGCGEIENGNFVNPLGHKFEDVVELPVCDPTQIHENLAGKNGKVTEVCSRCSTKGKVTVIEFDFNNPAHHPGSYFVMIIRSGDCDKSELTIWYCPLCEVSFYVEDSSMIGDHEPKAGETHVAYKAPTNTESGWYEHYECAKCPKTIYVDANGNRVAYTDAKDYVIPSTGE